MRSPIEISRESIDKDFTDLANDFTTNRLILQQDRLPTQFDRQIDSIITPAAGGGSSPAAAYPFDVISAGTSSFTVQPGTMSGILPTNYNNTFTLSLSTTYYLVLNCTASSGQIASAALQFASSAPSAIPVNMGQPPTSFSFLVGILITNGAGGGQWFRCIAPGSLFAIGALQYQTNKASPAPGTLPFDNWYTWLIEQV